MGEIADEMLEGWRCECCSIYLEGEGQGFPRYCSEKCLEDRMQHIPKEDLDAVKDTMIAKPL